MGKTYGYIRVSTKEQNEAEETEQDNFLYVPSRVILDYFWYRYLETGISLKGIVTDYMPLQEMLWRGLPAAVIGIFTPLSRIWTAILFIIRQKAFWIFRPILCPWCRNINCLLRMRMKQRLHGL